MTDLEEELKRLLRYNMGTSRDEARAILALIEELDAARLRIAKLEANAATTYHGLWNAVDSSVIDGNGNTLFRMWKQTGDRSGKRIGCYECSYFTSTQAALVAAALNHADVIDAALVGGKP